MCEASQAVISIRNMSFSFSDHMVFDDFNLDIRHGEFHYLLGQNATGKSTLVRLLAGHLMFQKGEIQLDDTVYHANTLLPARKHNIYTIHQSIGTFNDLTVFDNIYIPCLDLPLKKRLIRKAAQVLIDDLELTFGLDQPMSSLSMGEKRMVELIAAFILRPKVLILDEPGAFFTDCEMLLMGRLLEKIMKMSTTILYCTYRVGDLFALAERVTVIRDGKNHMTARRDEIDPLHIGDYLYGNENNANRFPRVFLREEDSPPLLSASHLTVGQHKLRDVSLTVRQGEIVGVTGISGAGKSLLSKAIIGDVPLQAGTVFYHPAGSIIQSASQAAEEGIGYLPEDPTEKLIPAFTTAQNITLSNLDAIARLSFISERKEEPVGEYYAESVGISSYTEERISCNYSYGEQQKINISRLLFSNARVIIADEPTNSVDVPSQIDLYNLFNAYVSSGNGMLLFSSNFFEICGMCDRVYVLRNGAIAAELLQPNLTVGAIIDCTYN